MLWSSCCSDYISPAEYMAPEVMNCGLATTSSDMWSVGVVAYMLLSGGKSPFYCGSRYRTMARSLSCEYDLGIPEMEHISPQAKDLVTKLLVIDSKQRYAPGHMAHCHNVTYWCHIIDIDIYVICRVQDLFKGYFKLM